VGLIAEPDISEWRAVEPGDGFLILASDGIFEALSEEEVCQVAAATAAGDIVLSWAVAECIIVIT
jgi:serine/threonine protein phosphatase PrpC